MKIDDQHKINTSHLRPVKRPIANHTQHNTQIFFSGNLRQQFISERFSAVKISNLHPDSTVETLEDFLKNRLNLSVKCKLLLAGSPMKLRNCKSKSFKVQGFRDELKKIINFKWPSHIKINYFKLRSS
jgi:hypothetical protein